ncbi:MAG: hypothetical protein ACE15B_09770 [Bryobacteraceae bacterium]
MIAFLVIRAILKSLWSARSSSTSTPATGNDPPAGGELMKDPVCGTYVAAGSSVTCKVDGKTLHFCSISCRDKYKTG